MLNGMSNWTGTFAFSPTSVTQSVRSRSKASLRRLDTSLEASSGRRDLLKWVKRTAFSFGISSLITYPGEVRAEEDTGGKIILITVNNLDGEEGRKGSFKLQLAPSWAPRGVARFEELTKIGFWNDCRIFRVLPGFVAQFGINGDPKIQAEWRSKNIQDDPVKVSNERGTVVFATAGPNTRTTQIFVNTRDQGNGFLDKQGFSPIGKVIEGMDIVDRFYSGYGEGAPAGKGPNQGLIQLRGNGYLKEQYPKLSYIESAIVME